MDKAAKKNRFTSSSGNSFSSGIGSSSILVIFVILCLVSFATLSIVSANADHKLSSKVLARTTAYYEACSQAETSLAQLENTLVGIYSSGISEEEYFATVGTRKSFVIPLSDIQTLEISVDILYPSAPDDTFYRVNTWQVVVTADLDFDEGFLPVMQ